MHRKKQIAANCTLFVCTEYNNYHCWSWMNDCVAQVIVGVRKLIAVTAASYEQLSTCSPVLSWHESFRSESSGVVLRIVLGNGKCLGVLHSLLAHTQHTESFPCLGANYRAADFQSVSCGHRGSTGLAQHLLRTTPRPIWPPLISL